MRGRFRDLNNKRYKRQSSIPVMPPYKGRTVLPDGPIMEELPKGETNRYDIPSLYYGHKTVLKCSPTPLLACICALMLS